MSAHVPLTFVTFQICLLYSNLISKYLTIPLMGLHLGQMYFTSVISPSHEELSKSEEQHINFSQHQYILSEASVNCYRACVRVSVSYNRVDQIA